MPFWRRSIVWVGAALVSLPAYAGTFDTIYTIPVRADGSFPDGALLVSRGQFLFGNTVAGGVDDVGTVFGIPKSGGSTKYFPDFATPDGTVPLGLVAVGDLLYGTAALGPNGGGGTLFSLDPDTNTSTQLYDFPPPSIPFGTPTEYSGKLYGSSDMGGANGAGYLYSFDLATGAEAVVHSFGGGGDGSGGSSPLRKVGELLYGVTPAGGPHNKGTLYRFDPRNGVEQVLYSFNGKNGYYPAGRLTVIGHVLYGVTNAGGTSGEAGPERRGYGVVFSYDDVSHAFRILYNFQGGADGGSSYSGLSVAGDLLIGTTTVGGAANKGTVFTIDPVSGAETVVHSFQGQDGSSPESAPVESDGLFYGTAYSGGSFQQGVAYSLDLSSGTQIVLHDFSGPPFSQEFGLTRVGGQLYGVSSRGGANATGSIYVVDVRTGVGRTVCSFPESGGGIGPNGPLLNNGGVLYGVTAAGGASGFGIVFSFDPRSRTLTTLYAFPNQQTGVPSGSLAALNGLLYGAATGSLQSGGYGSLFSVNPATGQGMSVFTFNGTDGTNPASGVIAADGAIYGSSSRGGGNYGTVYRFDPATGQQTVLHTFTKSDGGSPAALLYANGMLYGTADLESGTQVFAIDATSGNKKVAGRSANIFGTGPLVLSGSFLYGVSEGGGDNNGGTIFRVKPTGSAVAVLYSFPGAVNYRTPAGQPTGSLVAIGPTLFGTTDTIYSFAPTNGGLIFRFTR